MAAALLFIRPELFSRAILLRPMLPLSKQKLNHLEGKEILILRGTKDRVIPAESTNLLIEALNQAGAEVTVFDIDAGHALTETDVELASRWLADRRKSMLAHLSRADDRLVSRQ
jgi:phospholipase/carboxylesterase